MGKVRMPKRCSFWLFLIIIAVVGLTPGCITLPSETRETSRVEFSYGTESWREPVSLEASYRYSGDVLTVIATEDPKTPPPRRPWWAWFLPVCIIYGQERPFLLFQSESLPEDFRGSHKTKGRLLFGKTFESLGFLSYSFWVVEEAVADTILTPNHLRISYAGDARESVCRLERLETETEPEWVWSWLDFEKEKEEKQKLHYTDRKSALQILLIADRDEKHFNRLLKHIKKISDTGRKEQPLPEVYLGPFHLEGLESSAEPSKREE